MKRQVSELIRNSFERPFSSTAVYGLIPIPCKLRKCERKEPLSNTYPDRVVQYAGLFVKVLRLIGAAFDFARLRK